MAARSAKAFTVVREHEALTDVWLQADFLHAASNVFNGDVVSGLADAASVFHGEGGGIILQLLLQRFVHSGVGCCEN